MESQHFRSIVKMGPKLGKTSLMVECLNSEECLLSFLGEYIAIMNSKS